MTAGKIPAKGVNSVGDNSKKNNIKMYRKKLDLFNKATSEFLADLAGAYPGVGVFRLLSDLHDVAAEADPEKPLARFEKHVLVPYGEHLRREDFSFFENHPFEQAPLKDGVLDNIKALWKHTSENNRECIKAHLRVLMRMIDEVYAARSISPHFCDK